MVAGPVAKPFRIKGSGPWKVAYTDASGKLVQRTTGTTNYKDAVSYLEQWKTEIYNRKTDSPKPLQQVPKYTDDQLNSIIEEAVADQRISRKDGDQLKSLKYKDKRQKITHFFDDVDGKLVYRQKGTASSKTWPYRDIPPEVSSLDEYKAIKNRVRASLNSVMGDVSAQDAKHLERLFNNISDVKSIEDVRDWEQSFREEYNPLRADITDQKLASKDWRSSAQSSIDTDPDDWVKQKIRSSAQRHFRNAPEVLAGKKSATTLATEYLNNLTPAQMAEWSDTLLPIKSMNNRWYQVALDSGNPKYLDNIVEAHHLMPLAPGGTGLSPRNIAGASGSGFASGTEHGRMHSSILDPQYQDVSKAGGGIIHYAPEGSGGIDPKMYGPKWDKASGKLVYELLPSGEFVPGLSEYKYDPRVDPVRGAGFSDAPKHTPSIMNLKWLRNLPSYLGAAALLGTSMFPSREASADTWYGRMGQNLKSPYHWADFFTGLDSRGMVEGIKESLLDTQESRKKRYEDLLMSRRHRKRKEDLRDQGLLGVNI